MRCCLSINPLDTDIIHRLSNIKNESYFLNDTQTPSKYFLTILNDPQNRIVGKTICYQDAENTHCYITGQSGYGKTFLLSQLIAKNHDIHNKVIVFDYSDSLTKESLSQNLSPDFVEKFVTVYDIDRDGIPINLFNINHNDSIPNQKNSLLNVITAGIGELTASQSNALRTAISTLLSQKNPDEIIYTQDIMTLLSGEGTTYESLNNRIIPLLEDIEDYGMSEKTWNEFLKDCSNITIIRLNSAYNESSNALIDMSVLTCYHIKLQ